MTLEAQLDSFINQYRELQEPLGWPQLPWEAEWQSPCLMSEAQEGDDVGWRPVAIGTPIDMFERLGEALDTPIHPDLSNYYSRYWSDPIYAEHPDGELTLLFAWNLEEFERLRANLIGHALNKRRMRQPLTLFFACTEPDGEEFISLMNEDGSIWLEAPGKRPLRRLAESLKAFLAELKPLPHPSTR